MIHLTGYKRLKWTDSGKQRAKCRDGFLIESTAIQEAELSSCLLAGPQHSASTAWFEIVLIIYSLNVIMLTRVK